MQPQNPYENQPAQGLDPRQQPSQPQYPPHVQVQPDHVQYPPYEQPHPAPYGAEYGFHGSPTYYQPPARSKGGRKLAAVLAVLAVLVLAGGGGVYAMILNSRPTPAKVFDRALENMMSVSTVTQTYTSKEGKAVQKLDLSDLAKPKMAGVLTMGEGENVTKFEGFDAADTSYFRSGGSGASEDVAAAVGADQWIQVKKDGKYPTILLENEYQKGLLLPFVILTADAHMGTSGSLLMGNFQAQHRQQLLSQIKSSNAYNYDESQVTREELDGKPVFKYELKLNYQAVLELNQEANRLVGGSQELLDLFLENSTEENADMTFAAYIGIDDALFWRVSSQGDVPTTLDYKDYGTTSTGKVPTATVTWDEMFDLGTGAGAGASTDTTTQGAVL